MLTNAAQPLTPVEQTSAYQHHNIDNQLLTRDRPLILRNFATQWPLVQAGKLSATHAANYIRSLYSGIPVTACYAEHEAQGRIFYNDNMTGFNYQASQVDLNQVLDKLLALASEPEPPTVYVGSTELNQWLPTFNQQNPIELTSINSLNSIWLGNQSRIAAHYDFPNNIAVCAVGKRRFTLFPPDQIGNLYAGPFELSPGGQEISVVDFANPDFQKFPKFATALAHAQVAELNAGDALFLPSMWWHHVEALSSFNVLISHWWRDTPGYLGRPTNALLHALLSLRSLPKSQRKAWQSLFNYYIFEDQLDEFEHIPDLAKGMLKLPLDEHSAKKLRADLLNKLKR